MQLIGFEEGPLVFRVAFQDVMHLSILSLVEVSMGGNLRGQSPSSYDEWQNSQTATTPKSSQP